MPLAAQHPRAALAGVGGQQLPQHAAAELQQPGAQHSLGGPEPAVAAQRPGRFGRQPCYLGGPGFRERGEEPPFSPSGTGGACVRAAGRASQIRSFTSTICSTAAVNSAYRAISRRTFSTSAVASCRPTVLRVPADLVPKPRPVPGMTCRGAGAVRLAALAVVLAH